MKTLARRVRRLEEVLQRAAAPSARLFWDDEVVACGQHPGTQIKREVALAMPPPVAGVYLAHPDALPLHDCEDCGYGVPHEYFKQCPLCGGRVGWYAYWHRHKDDPRTD